jgi:molybdopterin/thiamine biosynthesis adenylyltransferase
MRIFFKVLSSMSVKLDPLRHYEIFNPAENDAGVTIIGAGAIGSRIFALLVEQGLQKITVYDPDIVENHNLANQLYVRSDVGKLKVEGLRKWTALKYGVDPHSVQMPNTMHFVADYVEDCTNLQGTVFLLVDSLASRAELAKSMQNNYDIPRVIDVRMAALHGKVITFSPHTQLDDYLATIGSDDDAEVSACGSPYSVASTASLLSSIAVGSFMSAKTDPASLDEVLNVFARPFAIKGIKL